jgi:hypothetical protein
VLQVVGDHAHEPHAERDRRIPPSIYNPVELFVAKTLHVRDRALVHRVVVVEQEMRRRADRDHIPCGVAVPGRMEVERQVEPLPPAAAQPHLLGAGHLGDVIVLHTSQVPGQPSDGVRLRIEALLQL